MSNWFSFLPSFLKEPSGSVAEAKDRILRIAEDDTIAPQTKLEALARIRQDFAHIRNQHADIASLEDHSGWLRLKSILARDVTGKIANWRSLVHGNVELLRVLEIWADAAERIMGIQQSELRQYNEASELLEMSDAELVAHVVGEQKPESPRGE